MTIVHLTESDYAKEVSDSKTPVIIDFWAPWCGPCQMMGPVFEKLSSKYIGKLKFAKVNTDDEPNLAQRFGIQGIPCLIIINKSKEIDRIVGYLPEANLKSKIDNAMTRL